MKHLFIVVAMLFVFFRLAAEEIVLTELKSGKIAVKPPGAEAFKPAAVGDAIPKGSWVMTLGDTDATVTFYKTDRKAADGNSTLQIGSYTKLKVEDFDAAKEKVTTEINVRVGHIISSVDPEEAKGNDYKVETPQVTAAIKGTVSEYTVTSRQTKSRIIKGKVVTRSGSMTKTLTANQQSTTKPGSMSSSIDSRLLGAQYTSLFTGSSRQELAFLQVSGLVISSPDPTGRNAGQDFRTSVNQSLSTSLQTHEPVCWMWVDVLGVWVPFLILPLPPGCDPPPPPPPPPPGP
ncbi:MAG: FecR domain-containing protein [Planctomycetota bacterium]